MSAPFRLPASEAPLAPHLRVGPAGREQHPDQSTGKQGHDAPFLVPLLSGRQRIVFTLLSGSWLLSLFAFWSWWLRPEHNVDSFRYVLNCLLLFWTTLVPGYFLAIFARARVPNPALGIPAGLRVAMVVTKAPSEPFELVRKTLLAMLVQPYPHDTWLADEDPTPETVNWCMTHGVQVSTRRGVAAYHNASWPRRTRCKEGNLAYFYDRYGYKRYDFVAQLDADHVPAIGYLEAMLRPFADPRVGYVSAPSICDSNAGNSWSARGRLHVEGALHGALQVGHNGGLAPLCIGSHYAVRTAALHQIGGLGPELAEDHSTTLIMNANGWRGVHALDAIANGEGPRTFADMVTQEFQWSKSLAMLLFRYTPRYLNTLPPILKAQFLFAQLWYPLFSLTMAATVTMPVFALLSKRPWANVEYISYFTYATGVTCSILAVMAWVKSTGCFRPHTAKVASWEGFVFLFVRWPWSLLGTFSALADWIRGREFPFRVTPKGGDADLLPPLRVILPYLFISLWCSAPLLAIDDAGSASGFYAISIFNGIVYLCAALLIVVAHIVENGDGASVFRAVLGKGPLLQRGMFMLSTLVLITSILLRLPDGISALLWRHDHPILGNSFVSMTSKSTGAVAPSKVLLGVYDPEGEFENSKSIAIDHVFVNWNDPEAPPQLRQAYRNATARNRWLIVTLEPWPRQHAGKLLDEISQGMYDQQIGTACSAMGSLNAPIFVRWGHEMENENRRYPWAIGQPSSYVNAYRRFVQKCRDYSNQLRFVWSPAGNENLKVYFPGKEYVDYIGLSVFDCPDCGVPPPGGVYSAAKIFKEKYGLVKDYDMPVMIAELGVNGSPERRRRQLDELLSSLSAYPLLRAAVYFNAVDTPGAWPVPVSPDWHLKEVAVEFKRH